MNKVTYLSNSQIDLWLHCPRQWGYRYVDGIKTPATAALIEGSVYHGIIEAVINYKIEQKVEFPVDTIGDLANTVYAKIIDEGSSKTGYDLGNRTADDIKGECTTLAEIYVARVLPSIKPIQSEQPCMAKLDEINFVSIIDCILEDGIVIDHKTSAKKYNQTNVDKNLQASGEAFALGKPIVFQNHVAVKGNNPDIQILTTYRTARDIEWWVEMVRGIIVHMNTGAFPPRIVKDDYLCSPTFCGYYDNCRHGCIAGQKWV